MCFYFGTSTAMAKTTDNENDSSPDGCESSTIQIDKIPSFSAHPDSEGISRGAAYGQPTAEEVQINKNSLDAAAETQRVVCEIEKRRAELNGELARQLKDAFQIDIAEAEFVCMANNNDAKKCFEYLMNKQPEVY